MQFNTDDSIQRTDTCNKGCTNVMTSCSLLPLLSVLVSLLSPVHKVPADEDRVVRFSCNDNIIYSSSYYYK